MFLYNREVEIIATKYQLLPSLVIAVCMIESEGYTWWNNPEPKYKYFWDVKLKKPFREVSKLEIADKYPPPDFYDLRGLRGIDADQEWWNQQCSWGLMQVMGAVAREAGFQEYCLTQLCNPTYGIEYGCAVLARNIKWSKGNLAQAIAAYNAGYGNWQNASVYSNKVLARQIQIQKA
jgi:hypothetical protein